MRLASTLFVLATALAATPSLAQKPGSLGNLPIPQQPQAAPGLGQRLPPRIALPRDKPPPLGGSAFPFAQGNPRPPGAMASLPRDKPPPLGVSRPGPGPIPGPGRPRGRAQQVSSGTGFIVAPRQIMTNHHVANGCAAMRARLNSGREIDVTIVADDPERDLALLRADSDPGPVLTFRRATAVRRGENVVTYGFPLAGLLSSGPTLTTGDVSALAGLADNPRQIQISAPVQQGNSGGPLLDLRGHVVGVIVSKLNAQRIAQATGDIPQNVNFAVKHTEAIDFMREHGVQPVLEDEGRDRTAAEVGELAHASTVFLRCMR